MGAAKNDHFPLSTKLEPRGPEHREPNLETLQAPGSANEAEAKQHGIDHLV